MAKAKRIIQSLDTPDFESIDTETENSKVIRALSWVGYEIDNKKLATEARGYLKANHGIDASVVPDDFMIVPGKVSYMLNRGSVFSSSVVERMVGSVKGLIERYRKEEPEIGNATETVRKSPAETIKENTGVLIAILDNWIDGYDTSFEDSMRSPYEIIRAFSENRGVNANILLEYFSDAHESLEDFSKDADAEEIESYGGRRGLRNLIKKYASVVSDIEAFSQTKRAARKPRKTKEKPSHKKVEKVSYRKEEPSLKIVSIAPDKVIGKRECWLYNTQYRKIIRLVAESDKTLDITGTTIQNMDQEASDSKMVRKPELIFPEFVTLGKVDTKRIYNEIRTKAQKTSGRLSDQVLILKVW